MTSWLDSVSYRLLNRRSLCGISGRHGHVWNRAAPSRASRARPIDRWQAPLIVCDTSKASDFGAGQAIFLKFGIRSLVIVPVLGKEQVLISTAIIAERIGNDPLSAVVRLKDIPLILLIDRENREVRVGDKRISVRGQSYELLCELESHAGRLCARRALVEKVFGETYDAASESQRTKLDAAIRRLRQKIEDDPDRPQYVLTERGEGYRLMAEGLAAK